jgi:hypothetical protein
VGKAGGGGLAVPGIQIIAVDIDGDGDIDLVAPGKSGLFLFEQIDFPRPEGTLDEVVRFVVFVLGKNK